MNDAVDMRAKDTKRLGELLRLKVIGPKVVEKIVKILTDKHYDPNALYTDPHGIQSNLISILLDQPRLICMVPSVIENGFDPKRFEQEYLFAQAVNMCSEGQHYGVLESMKKHGFNIHETNPVTGGNALFAAIEVSDPDALERLLQWGLDPTSIHRTTRGAGDVQVQEDPIEYCYNEGGPNDNAIMLALLKYGGGKIVYTPPPAGPWRGGASQVGRYDIYSTRGAKLSALVVSDEMSLFRKDEVARADLFIRRGHSQEYRPDGLTPDQLTSADLKKFYAVNKLEAVMQPQYWEGHEAHLIEVLADLPDALRKECGAVTPLVAAYVASPQSQITPADGAAHKGRAAKGHAGRGRGGAQDDQGGGGAP